METKTILPGAGWALLGLCLMGCGEEAAYTLRWRFADEAPGAFSARSCGSHGIQSLVGKETETTGGSIRTFRAVCAMGEMRRSIPAGVWKVELVGVDIAGNLPSAEDAAQMTGSAGPFELQLDGPESIVEVVVPPRPQCGDRIDNDRNGLVDGDDPSCVQGAEGLRM